MNMTEIFTSLYNESKRFYETSGQYLSEKKKLAGMLDQNFPSGNGKYSDAQMDMIRKSANGQMIRKAKVQADYGLESAFRHYQRAVEDLSGYLPEAVEATQKGLDISDPTLRNALDIAKLGKDLPMSAVRDVLGRLKTNRAQFEIVKNTMIHSGVNPAFFIGVSPYDGDDMATEYSAMVEKLRGRSDEGIYSGLSKVQDRILQDAGAFGVVFDPFISDEAKDMAGNHLASVAMGLKSDYQKSVEVLENL